MDLDALLYRYFGSNALPEAGGAAWSAGVDRMLVDFGLSQDPNARFALWALLHVMNAAPELSVAFPNPADRDAARNLMDLLAGAANSEG